MLPFPPTIAEPDARNDHLTREEMWDVCRRVRPDITEAEFNLLWTDFAIKKGAGYFDYAGTC